MPALIRPTYRYTDPTLTPPTPGAALVMEVGLVFSRPGIGPKGGGRHGGIPLSIGPTTTLLRRHGGTELRLPNTALLLWHTPFLMAGHRHGVVDPATGRAGNGWTGHSPTTSPTTTTRPRQLLRRHTVSPRRR